ncbi:MAG: isoaspartyl peptidase/L-asparaginase [Shewanella sp.]|nr:isoaspartyl peptidase/L-asparaginase [Shewanella sp.]MCF1437918.1 isoaspartyl peptidase/L-asparaginase [Shewanella sp.]MCF1456321.1 isoaspartyl peptidase/L-asparaginase [Shewanella sp.]
MKKTALSVVALLTLSTQTLAQEPQKPFGIAIHGGTGTISKANLTPQQIKAYKDKLRQAVEQGHAVLASGGDSLEAVRVAINVLEDSPLFNAGKGAVYTFDGGHELDASIMDGKTLNAGAVAGVKHIKNPINLALDVLNHSSHVMLTGEGAEEFALTRNYSLVAQEYFDTQARYEQLLKVRQKLAEQEPVSQDHQASLMALDLEYKFGTVGAVALDKHGNLAAGTSTGGMTAKRYGRIGDSPVIGAGTYAENNVCAVSATGHGEYFIRYHVAGDICARVKYQDKSIIQAADEVINQRLITAGGSGGVIAIDGRGNIATPFNTEGMYRATMRNDEPAQVMIWKSM